MAGSNGLPPRRPLQLRLARSSVRVPRSAERDRLLPEWQHLNVGDEIPIGRAGGFPIAAVDPERALVLAGEADGVAWVWQFGLYPIDADTTQLVSRNAVRAPRTAGSWLFLRVIEPAAFLMTRRMLLGLKERAEALATTSRARSPHAA